MKELFRQEALNKKEDAGACQDEITENIKEQQVADIQRVEAIIKQNEALNSHIISDMFNSENLKKELLK